MGLDVRRYFFLMTIEPLKVLSRNDDTAGGPALRQFPRLLNLTDIEPRLDLSFFRDWRCRCQAQRDMIEDNMEKEITITKLEIIKIKE